MATENLILDKLTEIANKLDEQNRALNSWSKLTGLAT